MPIGFAVVQSVHFFGMIVTELIVRERQARVSPTEAFIPLSRVGSRHSMIVTIARLPVDYGLLCLVFALLGAHLVFFGLYSLMAVAWAGYLLLALVRWFRRCAASDQVAPADDGERTCGPQRHVASPCASGLSTLADSGLSRTD